MSATVGRVDPRSGTRRLADGRTRVDRQQSHPAMTGQAGPPQIESQPMPPRELASFAGSVLVLPDMPDAVVCAHDEATLAAARDLADLLGVPLVAAVFAPPSLRLPSVGVDALVNLDVAPIALDSLRGQACAELARALQAVHVIAPNSQGQAGCAARHVAAAGRMPWTSRIIGLSADGAQCLSADGAYEEQHALGKVLLISPHYPLRLRSVDREAVPLQAPPLHLQTELEDLGSAATEPSTTPVDQAEFIVAAGAGVQDWSLFHQLVAALQATPAGSRVVVDAGHLPRERQVGASGASVQARVYLALGISGAIQHLEGIARCRFVISVNQDDACPMVERANLSVVGECQEVMSALLAATQGLSHG